MGTNKRHNASRDTNEPEIVEALEKAGCFVTRIDCAGVPDLLVVKPSGTLPIRVVNSVEQALNYMPTFNTGIVLMEVKQGRSGLTEAQQEWHSKALNLPRYGES